VRYRPRHAALALLLLLLTAAAAQAATGAPAEAVAWWVWPLGLFVTCFLMGIVAVPAGIGGGTLFVPIVGSFFPFHLDFVRGAGCWWRWPAPGRRAHAAARRPGQPAPGIAAGGAGIGQFHRRRDARPGHAGQRGADAAGRAWCWASWC
jgi:hypothetical protein